MTMDVSTDPSGTTVLTLPWAHDNFPLQLRLQDSLLIQQRL
jgi:hypothetical protein